VRGDPAPTQPSPGTADLWSDTQPHLSREVKHALSTLGVSSRNMVRIRITLCVAGVDITFLDPSAAADHVASADFHGDVHLCNAYTLALADERPDLAASLDGAALSLPDGAPLA